MHPNTHAVRRSVPRNTHFYPGRRFLFCPHRNQRVECDSAFNQQLFEELCGDFLQSR